MTEDEITEKYALADGDDGDWKFVDGYLAFVTIEMFVEATKLQVELETLRHNVCLRVPSVISRDALKQCRRLLNSLQIVEMVRKQGHHYAKQKGELTAVK